MILLTGWSQKLDGVAFLADTDNREEALTMFCDAWNDRFRDKMKVVHGGGDSYLLSVDVDDSVIIGLGGDSPGREGWQIIGQEVKPGEVIQGCPW